MKKHGLFIVLILVFYLFLWLPSLKSYFFQDDFLLLSISRIGKLSDLVDFFKPIPGFPYRPLATHFFYFFSQQIFGLKAAYYHILTLIWFMLNAWLFYKILMLVFSKERLALLGVFFYVLSPLHYMTFYWLAAFYFAQGATFFLAAVYFYLHSLGSRINKFYFLGLLSFVIGSLFNEAVLFLPLLLVICTWLLGSGKSKWKAAVIRITPFLLISGFLTGFRLKYAGLPGASDYSLVFDPGSIKTFAWYLWRVFGLPEGIRFIAQKPLLYALLSLFLVALAFVFLKELYNTRAKEIRTMIFGLSWYVIGALPFFFMPYHMSSYYLEISVAGMIIIWLAGMKKLIIRKTRQSVFLLAIILFSYLGLSFISVESMKNTHWVSRRAKLAEQLSTVILQNCPQASSSDKMIITLSQQVTQEAEVVLYQDHAAKVLCRNQQLELHIIPVF